MLNRMDDKVTDATKAEPEQPQPPAGMVHIKGVLQVACDGTGRAQVSLPQDFKVAVELFKIALDALVQQEAMKARKPAIEVAPASALGKLEQHKH